MLNFIQNFSSFNCSYHVIFLCFSSTWIIYMIYFEMLNTLASLTLSCFFIDLLWFHILLYINILLKIFVPLFIKICSLSSFLVHVLIWLWHQCNTAFRKEIKSYSIFITTFYESGKLRSVLLPWIWGKFYKSRPEILLFEFVHWLFWFFKHWVNLFCLYSRFLCYWRFLINLFHNVVALGLSFFKKTYFYAFQNIL